MSATNTHFHYGDEVVVKRTGQTGTVTSAGLNGMPNRVYVLHPNTTGTGWIGHYAKSELELASNTQPDPADGLNREMAALAAMDRDGFVSGDLADEFIAEINLIAASLGAPYAFKRDGDGYRMHPDLLRVFNENPDLLA